MNGTVNQPSIPREHFETHSYRAMAQVIQPNRALFDEWVSGVLFVIDRVPESFPNVDGIRRAVVSTGKPYLALYFCFDDTRVGLLGIEEVWEPFV